MPPLVVTKIRFRKNKLGKWGLPARYTAALFSDHVEFSRKNSSDFDSVRISEIAKAALGNGVIVMRLTNGETRSLYFDSVALKAITRSLSGGIISLLVMRTSKKRSTAAFWLEQLKQLGVVTVKV
ncbi:MAG: hypothetical protein NVS1B7_8500 [Candidatus Saccharimonadales bacterium]